MRPVNSIEIAGVTSESTTVSGTMLTCWSQAAGSRLLGDAANCLLLQVSSRNLEAIAILNSQLNNINTSNEDPLSDIHLPVTFFSDFPVKAALGWLAIGFSSATGKHQKCLDAPVTYVINS